MRFTILIIFLLSALPALADQVIIENNVSVSADSGGNSASDGEIIQGTSSVDVKVETIINGEVVEDIDIHEELASPAGGATSTPVIVEKKIENIVKGATTTTNIKVELNKDENYENHEQEFKPESFIERLFSRLINFLSNFKFSFF